MKIGLFSDSHYSAAEVTCDCRYNNQSLRKIKSAYEFFEKEECDLVVCLGDVIDSEDEHKSEIHHLKEVAEVMDNFSIPTIVLMGNHDAFRFKVEEFYDIVGRERQPKTILFQESALLFLDACYTQDGKHYTPPEGDWTDTFFPKLEWLKKTLKEPSIKKAYLFLHQNVDMEISEDHRISNAKEFCSVIEETGKVKAVYQGHYHYGNKSENNGIDYVTIPAMCQYEQAYFILEI